MAAVPEADPISTEASEACLAELRSLAGETLPVMERHCRRVIEIALELARRRRLEVDAELIACAAWLHDAGLYPGVATHDAYVADGRRLVQRVLAPFDWPAERLARAGDAVEMHHELRAQWDRGAEVELLRRADLVEVSGALIRFGLDRAWLTELFSRVPRDGFYAGIGSLVGQALVSRPTSLPKIFLRRSR